MTHTIIIETQNESVFEQVKHFAQTIGVPFSEQHSGAETGVQEKALGRFFGSWEGEESADELVAMIHDARTDHPRAVDL